MKSNFVKHPNLPQDKVNTVFIGEKYLDTLKTPLNNLGIRTIKIPDNGHLPYPVSSHADMSVCHIAENQFAVSKYIYNDFKNICTTHNLTIELSPVEHMFEEETNICIAENIVLHRLKHSNPQIINMCRNKGYDIHNVNQGYSKCSTCILDSNTIITADSGIHAVWTALGRKSLKIHPGFIDLPGYDTGFIGGSCVKLSKNQIAFTGKLKYHPEKQAIENFINSHGIEIIYLTNKNCLDVGSIIPVLENT